MRFWLGISEPHWLSRTDVGVMLSHRRLATRKSLPCSAGPWVLDSGGFSELTLFGEWRTEPREYAEAVARYVAEVGRLEWAAPQDWMCEPIMLAKTGLSVDEHQARTVENFCELRASWPHLPFIPVVQGWTAPDYERCADRYERAGVDLASELLVGVGSVCRRQGTAGAEDVFTVLGERGIRMHGFGLKTFALRRFGTLLASADSMAWSMRARRDGPRAECRHNTCAQCLLYALEWREELLGRPVGEPHPRLPFGVPA